MKSRSTKPEAAPVRSIARLGVVGLAALCFFGGQACVGGVPASGDQPAKPVVEKGFATEDLKEFSASEFGLDFVLEGLKEPLSKKLVGLLLGDSEPDYGPQLDAIRDRLSSLEALAAKANDRLTSLEAQLRVTGDALTQAGFSSRLSQPVADIETAFSGNASNGVDPCVPDASVTTSLCWYYGKDRTSADVRAVAPDFLGAVRPNDVLANLGQINGAIVPTESHDPALLDNYVDVLVGGLDPTNANLAAGLDALESRFITLLRTQIHGLQVLVAYYQFQIALEPEHATSAQSNLAATLAGYRTNFARQANAYLAAVARYVAVAGGNPAFLKQDLAAKSLSVDPALLARAGRGPALADAVRSIGASDVVGAVAPTSATVATSTPDVVHALVLARQTDADFGTLVVTASVEGDPSRTVSADVVAQTGVTNVSYAYAGNAAARELHTIRGAYGAFVGADGARKFALRDGWWVYDVNLPLPPRALASASAPSTGALTLPVVDLTIANKATGANAFSRTIPVRGAFPTAAGQPVVYVATADLRMDGPTTRVDRLPWTNGVGDGDNLCGCDKYNYENYGSGRCDDAPTYDGHANAADGAVATARILTGRSVVNSCNVQYTTSIPSTFEGSATNAVLFGITREVRTADTTRWEARTPLYRIVTMTCDWNDNWFGPDEDWFGANRVGLGGIDLANRSTSAFFASDMPTSCDPDYSDGIWFTTNSTLEDVSRTALASRTGTRWDGGARFVTTGAQTWSDGADSTLQVRSTFLLPFALSTMRVETHLHAFGAYAP